MIVENQSNIKIHFAGCEEMLRGNVILKAAQHKYSLFTAFPFICDELKIKHGFPNYGFEYSDIVNLNQNNSIHSIQDSGLFSLMFGKFSGQKNIQTLENWFVKLIEITKNNNYLGTCVEVDCQKLFGVDKAWEFREKMRLELPKNRIINVFHKEDGQKGLDKLIEFSDYIAISVPELRSLGQKNHTEKIANYIKNKKPSIDIHLLGCTENKLLKKLNFCSSADSTSWVSINRYGWFKYNNGKETVGIQKSKIKTEVLIDTYGEKVLKIFKDNNRPITESTVIYHCMYLMQVDFLIKQYSIYAGDQS
jgi:hypothetical protein